MKKLLCLLLCLLLPLTALAAPMRDMRESVLSESEISTMRDWLDKTVRQALPVEYDGNTYVGAYVYSCVEDGGCYVLECDVYLEDGSDSLPENAAEEALTWLCDATVFVSRDGAGYKLVSCEVGDYYAAQAFEMVENYDDGYSLILPDVYTANANDAYDYSYYEEDGTFVSGITYRAEDAGKLSLQQYAEALSGESEGDMFVTVREELGLITAEAAGMYVIVYAADGMFYSLTITYPEARTAEFTLYAEFLRNSFVIFSLSNG
jgi:hypothetical protein